MKTENTSVQKKTLWLTIQHVAQSFNVKVFNCKKATLTRQQELLKSVPAHPGHQALYPDGKDFLLAVLHFY